MKNMLLTHDKFATKINQSSLVGEHVLYNLKITKNTE